MARPRGDAPPPAAEVLAWLERRGTKKQVAELSRYGITATRPFGVTVGELRKYAKSIPADHDLALELWASGRYEARMLACMVDDPTQLTVTQMNAWVRGCDNWALVDTLCFTLFDKTPLAWKRIPIWARAKPEFVKRAAFALLWALSIHDKRAGDDAFLACLPILEAGATDPRGYVKKGVDMALRALGKRNPALNREARALAQRLAASEDATAAWIGRHAGKELAQGASRRLGRG